MVIEPIFESQFADSSYGFRPGRGCKDALREVERMVCSGLTHVVDVDIKGCFDNIAHTELMRLVKERIADGSQQKLRESLRLKTRRTSGKSLPAIIGIINPVLRGWGNFSLGYWFLGLG